MVLSMDVGRLHRMTEPGSGGMDGMDGNGIMSIFREAREMCRSRTMVLVFLMVLQVRAEHMYWYLYPVSHFAKNKLLYILSFFLSFSL